MEDGGGEYCRGTEGKASALAAAAAADIGEEGGEPSESTEMSHLLSTRANSWLIVTSSLVFRGFDMVGVEERGWKREGGDSDGSSSWLKSSKPCVMVPSCSRMSGWQKEVDESLALNESPPGLELLATRVVSVVA